MRSFLTFMTGLLLSTAAFAGQKTDSKIPCGDLLRAEVTISAGTPVYEVKSGTNCEARATGEFARNYGGGYPQIAAVKKCGSKTFYLLGFYEIVGASYYYVNADDVDVTCLNY